MKDLFQIQTESGQLWPDISAQLDALKAECTALLADKDAAHEATITRLRADGEAALKQQDSDYDEAIEKAMTAARADLDSQKQTADDAIGALQSTLEEAYRKVTEIKDERDLLAGSLAKREAAQDDLAARAKVKYTAAQQAFADLGAIVAEALTPAEEKEAAAKAERRAKLLAEAEALK